MNSFECRLSNGYFNCAGVAEKQYYVVRMHASSPVDAQEEAANRAQAGAAASDRALPGSFQAPAGFVLKGAACHEPSTAFQLIDFKSWSSSAANRALQAVLCILLTSFHLAIWLKQNSERYLVTGDRSQCHIATLVTLSASTQDAQQPFT